MVGDEPLNGDGVDGCGDGCRGSGRRLVVMIGLITKMMMMVLKKLLMNDDGL